MLFLFKLFIKIVVKIQHKLDILKMVFLPKNMTILLIYSFLLIKSNCSYVLLQFAKQENSAEESATNFTVENFAQIYIDAIYSSIIEVGTSPQKVELLYSSEHFGISMIEDKNSTKNYNFFNKKLSSSINITHSFDSKFYGVSKPVILTDTLFFPFYDSKLNKISKIELKQYPFVFLTKKGDSERYENEEFIKEEDGKAYMIFGSKVYCNNIKEICENFPSYLKHNNIIDSNIFNIKYNQKRGNEKKDFHFEFIIGNENPQNSPNIYNSENIQYIPALSYIGEINWIIQFNEVFYFPEKFKLNFDNNLDDLNKISLDMDLNDKKVYSYDDRGQMAFDLDIILCPKFYYFSINKTYFGNHTDKCNIQRTKNKYAIFVCDKDFNTESFPSIYFYHKEYNYTFTLTKNELFKTIGDKMYFLLVYDLYRPQFWMFGKIFLEKYSFNYKMESKEIGFNKNKVVNNVKKKKNYYLLINLIWLGIVLIILTASIVIILKKFYKQRKKRANELEDNYDYEINNDKNQKDIQNNSFDNDNKENKLID